MAGVCGRPSGRPSGRPRCAVVKNHQGGREGQTNMRAFPAMTNVANAELRLVFLSLMTGHVPALQYVHARGVLNWVAPHSPPFMDRPAFGNPALNHMYALILVSLPRRPGSGFWMARNRVGDWANSTEW